MSAAHGCCVTLARRDLPRNPIMTVHAPIPPQCTRPPFGPSPPAALTRSAHGAGLGTCNRHPDPAFWSRKLNVQHSPLFEKSLSEAITFFRGELPGMSDTSLESHLRPIDWSWHDCRVVALVAGERIYAYRYDALGKVGMYFTRSGYAARDLGIDPAGRSRATYVLTTQTKALWCRTCSILTSLGPCAASLPGHRRCHAAHRVARREKRLA